MSEPISSVRMKEIDYILRFPARFTKSDIAEAGRELRAEVERLGGEPLHHSSERRRP